jgi:hypothetical protein
VVGGGRVQNLIGDVADVAIEQRITARVFFEQRENFSGQRGVTAAARIDERALVLGSETRGLVEHSLNLLPARAIHFS